jgi:2-alkyl-3-oxoalkanoate reductase
VKGEDAPLDQEPVSVARESMEALEHLDRAVTDAGGIALRYGIFYGDPDDALVETVRERKFPVVGDGAGVWSFIHLDDAASATVLALEHDGPAVYNIVDDEPAPTREWLPELARIVGARPPQRFPRFLARIFAGAAPVSMATESRGASNAKAKRELGWKLRYPSWRQGFAARYGKPTAAGA